MNHQTAMATFAGLLHDVGKIAFRAGGSRENHSKKGFDFLSGCWSNGSDTASPAPDMQTVLDCVLYHHQEFLKNAPLPHESLAWLIYYADNVSAAADRRNEMDPDPGYFKMYMPMKPVFAKLNGNHDGYVLPPPDGHSFLPVPEQSETWNKETYGKILMVLRQRLKGLKLNERELNPLLLFLEDMTGVIPSSTAAQEVPDISLYDHVKITAAVAACLSEYAMAENITDFYTTFYKREKASRDVPAFLLYSADVSGIQKFIYTVSTKRALRSLRSRSFFLETVMEHYIDELLDGLGLSRANLLYSGGGHCYMLLPNTIRTAETLKKWNLTFNDWLLDAFGTRLYMADGWTVCTANELTNSRATETESPYKEVFRRVSQAIAQKKIRRYTVEQVMRMNAGGMDKDGRECRICGRSDRLIPDRYTEGRYLCHWCALFEDLTTGLEQKTVYVLERFNGEPGKGLDGESGKNRLIFPLLDGGKAYLALLDVESARKRCEKSQNPIRLYIRDTASMEDICTARLNAGVYAAKDTLDELADASKGIRRLGVCRMDVDNLGMAFVAGFERPEDKEPYRYVTLSRTSAFSRQMSLFFKRYINAILDGTAGIGADGMEDNGGQLKEGSAQLKDNNRVRALDIALVYSGGDDVFLVGAWNDTIEAARRIQWALNRFSCGAVTISAGIGMFSPHYPIRMAAERTAKLEDASKDMEGKNAITLFDPLSGYRCHWQEFRENVLGEKLEFVRAFFENPRNGRGKSMLYRILELLRESREDTRSGKRGKGIALARYAYQLSRLSPDATFTHKMYQWGIRPKDRNELLIAMELYVYETRSGTEETNGS